MDIKLLRNEDCHIWEKAEEELKKAIKEASLSEDYEIVVVKDKKEAEKYRFFGSPQILIDGKDIDPQAENATQFQVQGCRFYLRKGKMYEYPPKDMILSAFKNKFRAI